MAKQRMLSTRFWSDPWVVDELNPLDRYLFLYLLTNEKTNIVGVYELSLRTMSNETGIEKEELTRMLKRLDSRVVYVLGWVVFRNAVKHQNWRSPKIEAAIARELREVPANVLTYIEMPDNFGELLQTQYGIDTVSIPHASGIALNLTKPNLTKHSLDNSSQEPNAALAKAKPRPAEVPKADIDDLLEYWEKTVGYKVTNETSNRRAIAALVREFGLERVHKLVDGVKLTLDDRYAPRIADFVALKRKVNDLLVWGRRQQGSSSNVEVIS